MGRTFNGSSWLVKSGSNPFTTYPLSISCWYRYAAAGGEGYAACISSGSGNWLMLDVGSGTAYAWAIGPSTSNYATSSNSEVVAPAWNHAVGVFAAINSRTIYLNGVAATGATTSPNPTFAGASISVGGLLDGTGPVFNGFELGEVSFWDIALSAQEVAQLDRGVSPTRIRSGPKLYYPLDGSAGGHLVNRVNNSTDYTLALGGGTTPVASAHPPVQMPFGVRGVGWLGNLPPPYIPLVANSVAVGSPAFGVPAFTTFPRAISTAVGSPVLGQPAAKDKSHDTAFSKTLAVPSPGWQGRTLRQRLEPSMLSAVDPGFLKMTLQFAAGTSGQIDAAYVGHVAGGGDPYDFDGNQVQLKFSGANTMAVAGAGSVQSDAATFAYDPTRALIVSAAFSGTQVNLAAF